ncbi:MAG: hypothetical protein JOZ48_11515 [Acidobacteriaceae bacterium]|nr:hypothetical protein [Acidobacteriaceae bacterium]MBV9765462.1 hypothetical protein [Acidobacteriaceae bacterium]
MSRVIKDAITVMYELAKAILDVSLLLALQSEELGAKMLFVLRKRTFKRNRPCEPSATDGRRPDPNTVEPAQAGQASWIGVRNASTKVVNLSHTKVLTWIQNLQPIKPLLDLAALVLSLINGLMLLRTYWRDRAVLRVTAIHRDVYQWFFRLPDQVNNGAPTRRDGFWRT